MAVSWPDAVVALPPYWAYSLGPLMNWAIPYAPDDGLRAVRFHPASRVSRLLNADHWLPQPCLASRVRAICCAGPDRLPPPLPSPPGGTPVQSSGSACRGMTCGPIPPPWLMTELALRTMATWPG